MFRRRWKREDDLERELRAHLEVEAEEQQGDHDAARRALGNFAQVKEDVREAWGWTWIERLGQDLRYALRTMRQSPGFTATAVLSLALGIGANTAIFSLIDALMLRWLPVRDPQELVLLRMSTVRAPEDKRAPYIEGLSYAIVRALAEQKEIFAGVGGFSGSALNVGSGPSLSRVPGAWVTGAYYETLGLNPTIGRLLTEEDDQPGAPLVAVISYGYWERQFVRNPGVVGQDVPMNGVPVTIVGVSPPGFAGVTVGRIADITIPVAALPRVNPDAANLLGAGNFWLRVLARPRAEISISQAKARLAIVWPQIAERVISPAWAPARRKGMAEATFDLVSGGTGYTTLRETFRRPLLVLMGVVALVLLIACANVANLLLARAAARQREIAVRLAVGAGRARILRQLLTESTLLALTGAAFGIGLAWLSGRFLVDILSTGPAQVVFDLTPNWHVLGFTSVVAIAAAVLFGLAPAFQTTAAGPLPPLKEDGRTTRSRSQLLSSLVSVQVALSLLLVIGAGLFLRTLQNLQNLDPGFQREGVLLVDFESRRVTLPKELLDAVQSVPGVVSVSISTHSPLSGSSWSEPAVPKGQPLPANDNARFIGAGPGFFETMRMPLVSGRDFNEHDAPNGPAVAIVNEVYARRYFPDRNPVGQHLSAVVTGKPEDLEIVGVVKNANLAGLRAAPPATIYVSYFQGHEQFVPGQVAVSTGTLEIRARGSLVQVASAIQKEIQSKLPNDPPVEVRALSAQVDATMVQERMMATLAGGFGALALILACIGLYGLLAYSVARRTKELGIRMALGAQRQRVVAMVVNAAIRLVIIGVALGLPAAWFASRWVASMLFGLTPTDPATIVGAAGLMISAALLAAYLPARRASRVDPMTALRHE